VKLYEGFAKLIGKSELLSEGVCLIFEFARQKSHAEAHDGIEGCKYVHNDNKEANLDF
jgi:hypothetical protein